MKKYLIIGIGIGIVFVVSVVVLGYVIFFKKEVDDIAENGPIKSQIIPKLDQIPLFEGILAAGMSWDYDNDRFFIPTDQPHKLFARKSASFYVVNSALDHILFKKDLETDGDLEGIAYIGNHEVAIVSEIGTLYYMKEHDHEWEETHRASIFTGNGKPKLASLAYDPVNDRLYSAEKEGPKIIYQMNRSGKLLKSFTFRVGDIAATREFDIEKDYTIAGMTFDHPHLYILSEAYSTIFRYNPETKHVINVYGVENIHESSGITLKKGIAYLVGDFEHYLPAPSFYTVDMRD